MMRIEEQYFLSQINHLSGESAQASRSLLQAQTPLQTEIAQYRSDQGSKFIRSSVDILGWWSENQQQFPLLAQAAKKYLAVQATSCAVERTFSTSGNTVTSKRTLLRSKNVEMLIYVKENLPKVALTGLIVENAEEAEMEADATKQIQPMNQTTFLNLESNESIENQLFMTINTSLPKND